MIIQKEVLEDIINDRNLDDQVKKQVEISFETMRNGGFHYFTGIGKNGFVAAKVASTFNSLGIRSMFVDPVNTLHGDMDIFTSNDLVIAISKSGETEELLRFVQALHNIVDFKRIVAVVSKPNSSLTKLAFHTLVVPVKKEGDHLEMAPIASSVAYMSVLQSIAVELSSKIGFTKKDFVRAHPGGSLGKTKVD
nr:SIS domain-containing protein [Fervidobacterium pennivorans]